MHWSRNAGGLWRAAEKRRRQLSALTAQRLIFRSQTRTAAAPINPPAIISTQAVRVISSMIT